MTDCEQRRPLLPGRAAAVDLGMVLVLGLIAFYGLHDTYGGQTYLLAGGVGLLLGLLVAHVAVVLRQPFIVTAVLTVVAFFLFGGAIALRGDGGNAALPVPGTLADLADQGVHGWKELLTTLPPIDGGPLLALPYLLGLVAGAGGGSLALRLRSPWLPVLAPVTLLAAVILLGVQSPGQVAALGAGFAALAVVWLVVRSRRVSRTTMFTRRRVRQRATAAVLLAGAAAGAVVIGPNLPGTSGERYVLRSQIDPPFDVGRYPSLLSSFRTYTDGVKVNSLKDEPLVKVEGLETGALVRFTTLNAYDGTVWGASNRPSGQPAEDDTYQKVGSTIANPMPGKPVPGRVRVTIEQGFRGVWLPTFGGLRSIEFTSPRLEAAAEEFRYNLASAAGVMPGGLRPGDTYSFTAVDPQQKPIDAKTPVASGPLVNTSQATQFQADAVRWAGGAQSPMEQVLAVAARMRNEGAFTNGEGQYAEYRAGHSVKRIKEFVDPAQQPVGNDEQYAATMALLANQLGVPARVVMGAPVPADGVIKGADVRAWVELRSADGQWRTLATERFMSKDEPPQTRSQKQPELSPGETVPPPVPVRPPTTAGDTSLDSVTRRNDADEESGFEIPGIVWTVLTYVGLPLLVLALAVGAIVGLKGVRRRRRRSRGSPSRRLALAYRDLLDQARDLGYTVHAGRTRREQAREAGVDGLGAMAAAADARVFGRGDLTEEDAAAYWSDADRVRQEMRQGLTRSARLRAAINLASFAPLRRPEVEA